MTDPADDKLFWGAGLQVPLTQHWQANAYSWKVSPPVVSIDLSPRIAWAPSAGVAILGINQNTDPDGTYVSLWSDNPHVTCLPAFFPKGRTSANGELRIGGVDKETTVTITASAGGVLQSMTLKIMPGATIVGQVAFEDYQGDPLKVPATLYTYANLSSSPNRSFALKLASDGSFRLATDIYVMQDVAVKAPHWLSVRVPKLPLYGQETVTLDPMSLVNGDDKIDLADQTALTAAFRSTPESPNWNPNADLNGDGVVGGSDQAILSKNFGKKGGLG